MSSTRFYLLIFIVLLSANIKSQSISEYFKNAELINQNSVFCLENNTITEGGEKYLSFEFTAVEEEFLLRFFPSRKYRNYNYNISSTSDYQIIDSIFFINNEYYQTKIVFKRILDNPRLSLKVSISKENEKTIITELPLYPIAVMHADFVSVSEETFVGEESVYEIFTNLSQNVIVSSKWLSSGNINYRILMRKNELIVNFIPTRIGRENFEVYLDLKRPIRDEDGKLMHKYGPLSVNLNVKGSRLAFLNTNQKEIVYDETNRETGIEIELDYNSQIKLQTTYRIESQEDAGGALIAEIFTKSRLANNKVLCILRTYNYHNQSTGFLYLKEGDTPRFITNFSIIPHTNISRLMIMRNGMSWVESSTVYPGEDIILRIEGQSLQRGSFTIEDLMIMRGDTLVNRDDVIEFRVRVPIDVRRKSLQILNNKLPTGKSLSVNEYNEFRNFDYILIDYGNGLKNINEISGPQFYNKTIRDIIVSFDNEKIDSNRLHGMQEFDLDVRITGSRGEVFEVINLTSNIVSPGISSPRYNYYSKRNAISRININQHLRRKTYDLDDWVKIQLVFKPSDSKNTSRNDIKTIDIIVQRDFRFDIDVSFPAGLITKKFDGESGYGNLSGISMAMMAQFSFYQKDKIARFKPYKIGAGFIAINALNFSETAQRDMGIVIIGSLYPTTRESKMTFPLYFGGGYLLNAGKAFVLLGPGIRVSL